MIIPYELRKTRNETKEMLIHETEKKEIIKVLDNLDRQVHNKKRTIKGEKEQRVECDNDIEVVADTPRSETSI